MLTFSRFWAVIALTIVFDFCFWHEKMALNTLLFTPFYIGGLFWLFPESRQSRGFLITAAGMLVSAVMVTWHNSAAAKFAWMVSMTCVAGFAQVSTLRYMLYAAMQYIQSVLFMPKYFFGSIGSRKDKPAPGKKSRRTLTQWLGLAVVPTLVVLAFYLIYYMANDKFAELSDAFWHEVGSWFHIDISFAHVVFFLIGLFLCGGALWKHASGLDDTDHTPDHLVRQRPARVKHPNRFAFDGLRREFNQQNIMLWLLNVLLLVVNLTDIRYVWFGFDEEVQHDLKGYVHVGTYLLIVSILLAMAVLFFVFRKNLNFYPKSGLLRTASAIWLVQNAILALSVGVRTARYIDFHGLAYKRIGVLLFLLMVFFGLVTLWRKISQQKTMSWLWRQSGMAVYVLLILNACVNWDVWITEYNLSGKPRSTVDLSFMIYNMSDKNLYVLENNIDKLITIPKYPEMSESVIADGINAKRKDYEAGQFDLSWKSWNNADAKNQYSAGK